MNTTIAPTNTNTQELLTPYSIEYQREFLLSNAPPPHPFCGRDVIEVRKRSGVVVPKLKQLRNRCHDCRYGNAVNYASGESGWYVKKILTPKKNDWEKTREREKYRLNKLGAVYQGFAVQYFDSTTVFVIASSPGVVIDLLENGYDYYETRTDEFAAYLKSITVPAAGSGRADKRNLKTRKLPRNNKSLKEVILNSQILTRVVHDLSAPVWSTLTAPLTRSP